MSESKWSDRGRLTLLLGGVGAALFGIKVAAEGQEGQDGPVEVLDPFSQSQDILDCAENYEAWGYPDEYSCRREWQAGEDRYYNKLIDAEAEKNKGKLGQFFEALTSQLYDMLKGVFTTITTVFITLFFKNQTDTTQSFSSLGDAINKTNQTLEEEKLKNNTMVAPQGCESAILGDSSMKAKSSSTKDSSDLANKTMGIIIKQRVDESLFDNMAHSLNEKYGKNSEKPNGHFDVSLITKEINLNAEEVEQALGVVDNLTIPGFDTAYTDPYVDESTFDNRESSARKQLDMHQQHFLFARHVLTKSVTRRTAINQERSELGCMDTDIARTYGGNKWRAELNGFASPTPLHESALQQQALNNHITNERIHIREDKVRLCVLTTLARLSDPISRTNKINKY
jgi:hypothetical protein